MSILFSAVRTLKNSFCSILHQPKQFQTTIISRNLGLSAFQSNWTSKLPLLSLISKYTPSLVPSRSIIHRHDLPQGVRERIEMQTLTRMHEKGHFRLKRIRKSPLDGKPFMKGVVLKTLIKKPKKPNSANRKCVLVRLTNGREMFAYIPGIGHNLQEHNIVLVRAGRTKDVPGLKLKCVRGKYDLPHVIKH